MQEKTFIIYGAYGYTGELIVELCAEKGLKPILSGRSEEKLRPLAEKLGFEYIAAETDQLSKLDEAASRSVLILNCAGPFTRTIKQMVKYCLEKGLHYTDITGEITVFEIAASFDKVAKEKRIMLMPGTGFDVVPSDCLAAFLKTQLPDAVDLKLAFKGTGGLSHGTATTMVENIGAGGAIRKDGKITPVPYGYKTWQVDFYKGPELTATIPWGDVSTAWYSTGIPNIEVYTAMPPGQLRSMKMGNYLGWLLKTPFVNNILKKQIKPGGPSSEKRAKSASYLYGEVFNAKGEKKKASLKTLDGYTLTAVTAVLIAEKILKGNFKSGFATPSLAYGADLIMEVPGTERES
jgi:short subunit dehydrogenase-like uncharacterized protein